jgi:predicted nucleotidyltransferase
VTAMAHRRPEIERVLLCGSLATGRAVPGSDADLLMILTYSDLPFLSRIPRYIPEGCGIAVDVFPLKLNKHRHGRQTVLTTEKKSRGHSRLANLLPPAKQV